MYKFKFLIASTLLFLSISSTAHVTLEPSSAPAGEYAKLVFRVPHGCEGSATVKITVKLPEGVLSVKPQVHPGWKISTKKTTLKEPAVLHGKKSQNRFLKLHGRADRSTMNLWMSLA